MNARAMHASAADFRRSCLAGSAALCLLFGNQVYADEVRSAGATKVQTADGADVYRRICAGCHMPNGAGARGAGYYPALAANPALISKEYAARVVLLGRRNMPAFSPKHAIAYFVEPVTLTDEQVAAVVNFVRSNFGNSYKDRLTAKDVAALDGPKAE